MLKKSEITLSKNMANAIFICMLSIAAILILWDANWTLGDDCQFIKTTAIGKPVYGWCGSGRFWPLGLFDCSILLFIPFGHTAFMHLAYSCVMMIASSILFFNLLKKITNHDYASTIISMLILFCSAAFMQVHMACYYAERVIFFLFSIIMFCLWMGERSRKTKYYVCAFIASVYVTYTKEPIFGALGILALTKLVFGAKDLMKKEKIFYALIIANCVFFLAVYVIYFFYYLNCPPINSLYRFGDDPYLSFCSFKNFFYHQWERKLFLIIIMLQCIIRAFFVFFKKDKKNLLLDSFLFAGTGYMCAYFILGFSYPDAYYTFPAVVLGLPPFAKLLNQFKNKNIFIRCVLGFTIILLLVKSATGFKQEVNKNLKNRANDMLAIKYLAEQCNKGKTLVFIHDCDNIRWLNCVIKDVAQNFYGACKMSSKIITNPNDIDNNSIVIFSAWDRNREPFKQKMHYFRLYRAIYRMEIYVPKE